jgi:hypothetical protein
MDLLERNHERAIPPRARPHPTERLILEIRVAFCVFTVNRFCSQCGQSLE